MQPTSRHPTSGSPLIRGNVRMAREWTRPLPRTFLEMSVLSPPATLPEMRKVAGLALAVVLGARAGGTGTAGRKAAGDRLDVRATAAPISEVLDRIARETGMK